MLPCPEGPFHVLDLCRQNASVRGEAHRRCQLETLQLEKVSISKSLALLWQCSLMGVIFNKGISHSGVHVSYVEVYNNQLRDLLASMCEAQRAPLGVARQTGSGFQNPAGHCLCCASIGLKRDTLGLALEL